jgi:hypothetical protein
VRVQARRRRLAARATKPASSSTTPVAPPPPLFGRGFADVDDVNVPDTPPTVSVVTVAVLNAAEAVCRTHTLSPLLIMLLLDLKTELPQPMEYSPPATLISAGPVMPEIVTALDVTTEPGATPA